MTLKEFYSVADVLSEEELRILSLQKYTSSTEHHVKGIATPLALAAQKELYFRAGNPFAGLKNRKLYRYFLEMESESSYN